MANKSTSSVDVVVARSETKSHTLFTFTSINTFCSVQFKENIKMSSNEVQQFTATASICIRYLMVELLLVHTKNDENKAIEKENAK